MKYKVAAVFSLAVILFSCSSTKSTAPTAEAKKVEMTPELAEGKMLFENNCSKCHKLYAPSDFSAEKWKPIVARMQKKARLDELQGQKIYNYVSMK